MNREAIINYDKNTFRNFLENDYTGKILELFNDEGIELLKNYNYIEERINYILCYCRYRNELLTNDKFLDLFLNTDISEYYANLHSLSKDAYEYIIKKCIELGKDNHFIAKLFSYFNKDYKLSVISSWPYSIDLLYEVFKTDLEVLGPRIMKKYNIDLTSHNISIERVFNTGRTLALKEVENRNLNNKETETLYIDDDKITKELLEELWRKNDIFKYRRIINDASYCCDPSRLNNYAKVKEDEAIKNINENGLTIEYSKIYELVIKLSSLEEDSIEYRNVRYKIIKLLSDNNLYELSIKVNMMKIEEIKEYLEKLSNQMISNYIIDYHFEENYYNIIYDIRELLDFYYAGNISLPKERLSLYNKIVHIDELSIEDKKYLHEELKKYNMIELFYDDMSFARKIVRQAIKDYSLTKEEMAQYKDEELSKEYGIDVYNIKDNPFFAIVKSGSSVSDRLPTGHSYSLIGSGCIGVFADVSQSTTFVYDTDNLNSDQIVHVYPMDSFTLYKPFSSSEKATSRVQPLMFPDELLHETKGYNELLILEEGREITDIDKKIPQLKRMALYCVDKITKRDVEVAEANGIGIFLVSSKDYHIGYDMPPSIYRHSNEIIDYWNYDYFNGSYEKEKHERNR